MRPFWPISPQLGGNFYLLAKKKHMVVSPTNFNSVQGDLSLF